jgi:ADP-heptose:LPS heptosyltransferase
VKREDGGVGYPLSVRRFDLGHAEPNAECARVLDKARRVLIGLRWGIGDLVTELPMLAAVRRACPRAHLVGVGARPAVELLAGRGLVDEVVAVQDLGYRHLGHEDNPAADAAADAWLAAMGGFDALLDVLHVEYGLRRKLQAAAWANGWPMWESDQAAQNAVTAQGGGIIEGIAWGARVGFGIEVPSPARYRLVPGEADAAWARQRADGEAVAVAPLASHPLKRWPIENFAKLIERLDGEVRLLTAPGDNSAATLAKRVRRPVTLVPAASLNRIAAMLGRCRTFVGNDTGLMHLARAAGCPTVGVFGPTCGTTLLPNGTGQRHVGATSPCAYRVERRYGIPQCWVEDACLRGTPGGCITEVTVDDVLQQVRAVERELASNARISAA